MRALTFPLGQHGRLGNTLHQLAATVGVARTLDVAPVFDPDWAYRPWFSCPDGWFSDSWRQAKNVGRVISGNHWERTYLQQPERWAHVAEEIRAAFAPSERAARVLESIPEPPEGAVAVHVRRTDYLDCGPEYFPLPDQQWYADACDLAAPRAVCHVFGDDEEWARENLPWAEWKRYGQGENTDWADLFVMARYHHHVISNSSYAWWAAWLSDNPSPVAPAAWFGPKIDVPSPVLPEWITL